MVIFKGSAGEGGETSAALENILSLDPGETLPIEYDQEFSHSLDRSVTLAIVMGDLARHDLECNATNNLIGAAQRALLGALAFEGDSTPDLQKFNEDIMKYGRIVAASRAFEECVEQNLRSTYRQCIGDPWFDAAVETQIQKVIEVSRSVNTVNIFCAGATDVTAALGNFDGRAGQDILFQHND